MKKLIAYDATVQTPLRLSFVAGAARARILGIEVLPVTTWAEIAIALDRAVHVEELQIWGHGSPGHPVIGKLGFAGVLCRPGTVHRVWLRACSVFAGHAGLAYAREAPDQFGGATVYGHTHVIHAWQSGLHSSREDGWPEHEGRSPVDGRALWSTPWAPRTVSCLALDLPPWAI